MIIKNPRFEVSAVKESQYPQNGLPEVVLVGKSNVGKSSFVNTMINRRKLARTSSEPGKTRQLNFYNMDDKFYFVDLPGYGYSKMSKQEQAKVGTFIEEYLLKSKKISLIIFLIDIRHDPTANDRLMYDYVVRTGKPCLIIVNKADKIAVCKEILKNCNLYKNSPKLISCPTCGRIAYDLIPIAKEIEKFLNESE